MATKPILLRPEENLADAMAHLAEVEGVSRQAWMLDVLEQAVMESGHAAAFLTDPADVPLPGV